jgi:hypothetical protein
MDGTQDQWRQLCEQAAVEQDTTKLQGLIDEINRLFEEKHDRRTAQSRNVNGNYRLFLVPRRFNILPPSG